MPAILSNIGNRKIQQNYNHLLQHARRHIRHDELTGDIAAGALDPRDIVDEVVRQTEANVSRKPNNLSWLVWLFHLLHEELRRQCERLKQEAAESVPTEQRTTLPEQKAEALQPLEQMVEKVLEPEIVRVEDVIPNQGAVPPDRIAEEKELVAYLQSAVQRWPRPERELFELYWVQSFEPTEIAWITGQPIKQVKSTLATVQARLREQLRQEQALV